MADKKSSGWRERLCLWVEAGKFCKVCFGGDPESDLPQLSGMY
jgi:hypothetical protein